MGKTANRSIRIYTNTHIHTKSKITKNKNSGNVPLLEITEVVLIHCNVFNNSYQQNLRVLYTFVHNKSFGQLLDI